MNAIETTATFDGPARLRLTRPVDKVVSGEVRVIVLVPEAGPSSAKDIRAAIGSYYRDYPGEVVRDSNAWLKELREGEAN